MTTQTVKTYCVYYRISTKRQGESGLGLEAQARDVSLFLDTYSDQPYEVIGTFTDTKSGKDLNRPALNAALALCRETGAELLTAKLDRLSRDVEDIAKLLKDKKLSVRIASMPNADKFQLHIYSALAEQERTFISLRTKAALTSAKARGVVLGGLRENTRLRNVEATQAADAAAQQLASVIVPMRKANASLAAIADALNAANVPTQRGGKWYPTSVKNVLDRLAS